MSEDGPVLIWRAKRILSGARRRRVLATVTVAAALSSFGPGMADAAPGDTSLVSVSQNSTQGTVRGGHSLSSDGRYAVFSSTDSDVVPGDTNGVSDVFVRDLVTGTTTRVSVGAGGAQGNGMSHAAAISANGRYVAFLSIANNLVVGDTNGVRDIFVRDLVGEATTIVPNGTPGADWDPALSGDGRYLAFSSDSSGLVPGDTGERDVFVRDLVAGTTTRASVNGSGVQANGPSARPALSADGRYVAFHSGASDLASGDMHPGGDVFVRDLVAGTTMLASVETVGVPEDVSFDDPSISADGRYVAFVARPASTFSLDDDVTSEVFVRDLVTGTTTWVSIHVGRVHAGHSPAISADGRYVAFNSTHERWFPGGPTGTPGVGGLGVLLLDDGIFVRDLLAGTTTHVSVGTDGREGNDRNAYPSISGDGRYVIFASQADNLVVGAGTQGQVWGVFARDLLTEITSVVSMQVPRSGNGRSALQPAFNVPCAVRSISASGGRVAFWSGATDLAVGATPNTPSIFVRALDAQGTTLESTVQASGGSSESAISADGRFVAFASSDGGHNSGDLNFTDDIFVRDLVQGTLTWASVTPSGGYGDNPSTRPSISGDGRYVAFESTARNLVVGDSNDTSDIFVRDLSDGTTIRASVDGAGGDGNGPSRAPSISADGRYVAFQSDATNLVPGDTNSSTDVFVRDLASGTTIRASVDGAGGGGNSLSRAASLSADGRYLAFQSDASNLVVGDTNWWADVFVRDLDAGTTTLASISGTGAQGNWNSSEPSVSADGRYVAFQSTASNLVAGDTSSASDIFVRDLVAGTTRRVSVDSAGIEANHISTCASISADGRYVVFQSTASNLVPGDANGNDDVFIHELAVDNDPDGDGLSVLEELALGTNPLDPDSDDDGYLDGVEFAEETDPLSSAATPCGNGTAEGPEVCDDGDALGGDGCSSLCQVEPGFQCSGQPSACTASPQAVPALPPLASIALVALLSMSVVLAARARA